MQHSTRFPSDDSNPAWTARIRWSHDGHAVATTRNFSIAVGSQASFRETDQYPDALEHLLAAVGGDLLCGFSALVERRGITIHAMEASLSGRLNNPLVLLGVVGEEGHPGLEALWGTVYISADAEPDELMNVWQTTLQRSPMVNTLSRCASLSIQMQVVE